jgi:TP901 family phage tail tape measure protein
MADIDKIVSPEALKGLDKLKGSINDIVKGLDQVVKASESLDTSLRTLNKSTETATNKNKQLNEAQKEAKRIENELEKSKAKLANLSTQQAKELQKVKEAIKAKDAAIKEEITGEKKLQEEIKKEAKARKESEAQIKKEEQARQSLQRQRDKALQLKQKEIIKTKEARDANRALAKQFGLSEKQADRLQGAYAKDTKRLNELRLAAKNTGIAFGTNSKQFKAVAREVNQLDNRLKKLDSRLGQSQRNVGNYASAFQGLGAAMGIGLGAAGIFQVLRSSLNTIKDFEQAMARVSAISGASSEQFKALEQDALRLGQSTKFTATEVANLQLEFSKIGFSAGEIVNATEATLQLATATGEDLARSAEIAGATLRGFGLDASETQRVVDVMAKGFTTSALDLENFAESMKLVAPLAKAANIPIEVTTKLLGQLADAGLKGSIGGTGLKNVLIALSDSSSNLSKELGFTVTDADSLQRAFIELNGKGLGLAEVQELIDLRGQAALLTLSANKDAANLLASAYEGVDGSAKKMADVVENTLAGAIDRLGSAWDGLILSGKESTGFLQTALDSLSFTLNNITELGFFESFIAGVSPAGTILAKADKSAEDYFNTILEGSTSVEDVLSSLYGDLSGEQQLPSVLTNEEVLQANIEALDKSAQDQSKLEEKNRKDRIEFEKQHRKILADTIKESNNEIKDLTEESYSDQLQELEDLITETNDFVETNTPVTTDFFINELDRQNQAVEESTNKRLIAQVRLFEEGTIKEKEFNDNVAKIYADRDDTILQNQVDTLRAEIELIEDSNPKKLELLQELADKELEIDNIKTDAEILNAERAAERKRELQQELLNIAQEVGNTLFSFGNSIRESELLDIEEKQKQGLLSEEQAAKKVAEIKRKQAIADKASALFNIGINTAQAILKVQAQTGVLSPLAIPLIIASGALQTAAVLAKPIPKFAKGTGEKGLKSTTMAEYGEKGRELVKLPTGETFMANQRTQSLLPKGTRIWSNPETEAIMANVNMKSEGIDIRPLIDSNKEVVKAIQNKKEYHFNYRNGTIIERDGNYYKNYINKKISGLN